MDASPLKFETKRARFGRVFVFLGCQQEIPTILTYSKYLHPSGTLSTRSRTSRRLHKRFQALLAHQQLAPSFSEPYFALFAFWVYLRLFERIFERIYLLSTTFNHCRPILRVLYALLATVNHLYVDKHDLEPFFRVFDHFSRVFKL